MTNRNLYKRKSGIIRIRNAIIYSVNGFYAAWHDEAAFRQIIIISIVTVIASTILAKNYFEFIILILPIFISIIVELINSSIENISDLITLDENKFIKKAKDMGSAAQFQHNYFYILFGQFLSSIVYLNNIISYKHALYKKYYIFNPRKFIFYFITIKNFCIIICFTV